MRCLAKSHVGDSIRVLTSATAWSLHLSFGGLFFETGKLEGGEDAEDEAAVAGSACEGAEEATEGQEEEFSSLDEEERTAEMGLADDAT